MGLIANLRNKSGKRISCSVWTPGVAELAATLSAIFRFSMPTAANDQSAPSSGIRLKRVLVAGETVWENGKRTGSNPGVFLRGR